MSRSLARHMARAVLVIAAGAAAPVAVMPGQASAASLLDNEIVDQAVDSATGRVTELGNGVGEEAVREAMPIVAPALRQTVDDTVHTSGTLVHGTTRRLAANGPSPARMEQLLPPITNLNVPAATADDMHALSLG